jgi:non-heme Fe2+,alpha-ketoglutarate-dependent halogenase
LLCPQKNGAEEKLILIGSHFVNIRYLNAHIARTAVVIDHGIEGMSNSLLPKAVERYNEAGVLFPIPVLTVAEVRRYRSAIDEVEALNGGMLKRLENPHFFFRWAHQLATHESVIDAVASMLGEDILIDGSLMLCKYPHDPSFASWHQDSVYSGWHLTPSVSAWIALSVSDARSGCMRVIAGSHKRGVLRHEEVPDHNNLLRRGERITEKVDESSALELELRPGEMSLHHCNVIHGSHANRSVDKRIGFIVRFVTSKIDRKDKRLVKVRGSSDCRHLDVIGAPDEADAADGLARWREFNQRRQQSEASRMNCPMQSLKSNGEAAE